MVDLRVCSAQREPSCINRFSVKALRLVTSFSTSRKNDIEFASHFWASPSLLPQWKYWGSSPWMMRVGETLVSSYIHTIAWDFLHSVQEEILMKAAGGMSSQGALNSQLISKNFALKDSIAIALTASHHKHWGNFVLANFGLSFSQCLGSRPPWLDMQQAHHGILDLRQQKWMSIMEKQAMIWNLPPWRSLPTHRLYSTEGLPICWTQDWHFESDRGHLAAVFLTKTPAKQKVNVNWYFTLAGGQNYAFQFDVEPHRHTFGWAYRPHTAEGAIPQKRRKNQIEVIGFRVCSFTQSGAFQAFQGLLTHQRSFGQSIVIPDLWTELQFAQFQHACFQTSLSCKYGLDQSMLNWESNHEQLSCERKIWRLTWQGPEENGTGRPLVLLHTH